MSQIPDVFQGHDLTGWTSHPYKIWPVVIRATEHWDLVRISPFSDGSFEAETLAPMAVLAKGTLSECVAAANKYAEANGGWAPAPIGYELSKRPITGSRLDALTPTERSVAKHLMAGLSNKAIAAFMQVSEKTVKNHVSSVFKKLSISSRRELSNPQEGQG